MTYSDTHPAAEEVLNQLLRQAPVWRKLQMLAELNHTAHQLAIEGLREKFPDASEPILRRHLADLLLGSELAERVYGPLMPQ